MRTTLPVMFVLLLAATTTSFSQASGVSAVAVGSFSVGAQLFISPSDGDFGDLSPGVTYAITADGSITPPDAAGNTEVTPVIWEIEGQPGANVLISFALPPYFEGDGIGGGGARVPYAAGIQSGGWSDATFTVAEPYNPIDPRVPNTIFLVAGGAAVQLGGMIAVPSGVPETDYETQVVLTAAYTGL